MDKRLFLAIELPNEMRRIFFEWQENYRNLKGARWTAEENLHITLAFLGNVEENRIQQLIRELAVELKNFNKFKLAFKAMVLAPVNRPARMIWADFYHSQKFNDLANKILSVAKNYAEPEIYDNIKNPVAHVTMARLREAIYLNGLKQPELNERSFEANKVLLMESELLPAGPKYKAVAEFRLVIGKPVSCSR